MWRRGLVGGIGIHRQLSRRQPIFQLQDIAPQSVDLLPLRGDHLVEIVDHRILMREANFKGVEARRIGHEGVLAHPGPRRKQFDHCWAELRPLTEGAAATQWRRWAAETPMATDRV